MDYKVLGEKEKKYYSSSNYIRGEQSAREATQM